MKFIFEIVSFPARMKAKYLFHNKQFAIKLSSTAFASLSWEPQHKQEVHASGAYSLQNGKNEAGGFLKDDLEKTGH